MLGCAVPPSMVQATDPDPRVECRRSTGIATSGCAASASMVGDPNVMMPEAARVGCGAGIPCGCAAGARLTCRDGSGITAATAWGAWAQAPHAVAAVIPDPSV